MKKLFRCLFGSSLFVFCEILCAQTNDTRRLFIPYMDPASQSNVTVTICDLDDGQPCPKEYINVLSNRNLFTLDQQKLIEDVFEKYKSVTTNCGPSGTVLVSLRKTNYSVEPLRGIGGAANSEEWVARFRYTNSNAQEEIRIDKSISANFRKESDDGYKVFLMPTGNGTLLRFSETKHGLINGVMAEFEDAHPQGTNWNYRRANFETADLVRYFQYSNGMVLGKFLMWNPRNGNLMVKAEFDEPYDWGRHYRPPYPQARLPKGSH